MVLTYQNQRCQVVRTKKPLGPVFGSAHQPPTGSFSFIEAAAGLVSGTLTRAADFPAPNGS